ncbi:MAG TPA: septal ring lytic transglycosylase RlpA family protein [Rudaea sp.]|jgi:rare lipoprotein A|nr:septal ring lytic transglycosylase RlpA family protein [Rudaea sp.]
MMRRCARLCLALAALSLTGCFHHAPTTRSSTAQSASPNAQKKAQPQPGRYADDDDSGPKGPPPDVSKIPEPVPKSEPKSQYGNKSPYNVLGETYRVLPTCAGYVERGIASWYGNKFHGYMTSNFEKYDMYAYTAASKTLPLPCYVRVTNLENGKSAIVRVNDRGPFAANRIVDLSYVAAVKLGVWPKGTAMVEVRAVDPDRHPDQDRRAEPSREAAVSAAPQKTLKPALYLQVGAFSDASNAERAASRVRAANIGDVQVVEAKVDGKTLRRVRLGPLRDADEADRLVPKLKGLGLGEPRVAVDN